MLTSYEAWREREDALAQEAMTQAEYMSCAVAQYAAAHGAESPEVPWILSPFDTWERNPAYQGPAAPHPEEEYYDYDAAVEQLERVEAGAAAANAYWKGYEAGDPDDIPF